MTTRDLTDEELERASDDLHDFIECQCGPGKYRDQRHQVVDSLIAEVRRRRETMALLVPWVDHEDTISGDCTGRCPACLLKRDG